jgi:hypothetical protein
MLTTLAVMPKCKRLPGAKIVVHEDDAIMLTSTPAMMLKMFGAKGVSTRRYFSKRRRYNFRGQC